MNNTVFDVIIIGGGPIGLACAIEAKKSALSHVVIEKGAFVNSLFNYPVTMTFFSTAERLEIGGLPFVSVSAKPGRNEALEYYRRVALYYELNIRLFEEVLAVNKNSEGFIISSSKQKYKAKKIIVATGFYNIPYLLHVPGEHLPKVTHYYKDPAMYAFQKVMVIGANNSAVDAALETWRKGAEVTMVVKGAAIGTRVKYWVKPDIENRIKEGSIKAYFNAAVTEIRPGEVTIQTADGKFTIANDFVIAATGYQPDLAFLKTLGIELCDNESCTPVYNPDTHETNVAGIYIAGVICGGRDTHSLFIENSREHATKIIDHVRNTG